MTTSLDTVSDTDTSTEAVNNTNQPAGTTTTTEVLSGEPNNSSSDNTGTTEQSNAPQPDGTTENNTAGTTEQQPGDATNKDWVSLRAKIANGDEKILNRLSRYSTLEEAIKAGVEAQNKIGSIKKQPTISADSTPEEVAEYRKANGIPDTPGGYEINLGDGLVLGDADKPIADEFLKVAHEHNLTPRAVNAIIAQHLRLQDQAVQQQEDQDIQDRTATTAALTSNDMWGREARLNANLIHNMLETAPPGVKEGMLHARLPNGKLIGNDVEFMQWLASTARAINPYATVVPANGMDAVATVDAEIKAIEAKMGTPEYYKDEQMQERYRQLISMKQKAK